MRILGISGSLRAESHNTKLLREAAKLLPESCEFVLFDGLADVPPYNEDHDHDPRPVGAQRFIDAINQADGLLFSTPEYNFSIPGQLKNAIDWASRPKGDAALAFTPAAVMGTSKGMFGAVWAQAELRKVLGACGARVIDGEVAVGGAHEVFDNGAPLSEDYAAQLQQIVTTLLAEVTKAPAQH
jgi:chromate reductase